MKVPRSDGVRSSSPKRKSPKEKPFALPLRRGSKRAASPANGRPNLREGGAPQAATIESGKAKPRARTGRKVISAAPVSSRAPLASRAPSPKLMPFRRAEAAPSSDGVLLDPARDERLRSLLLAWFTKEKRELPWRTRPSAYGTWVSEVMLQQTRVATVIDYYTRFLSRFPSVESLANAEEGEVLRLWQGLGYYSRARRLQQGARYVVEHLGGQIPSLPEELLRIPGVGPYTAGAIASIAFGERAALADGNVMRVLSRLDGIYGDPKRAAVGKKFWQRALELLPTERPGDFNQALMELGAMVCTPRSPVCLACPLRRECFAHRESEQANLPQLSARAAPKEAHVLALLIVHRGRVLLEELPVNARWWAGLFTLPCLELGEVTQGALSRSWAALASGLSTAGRTVASPQGHLALVKHLLARASLSDHDRIRPLPTINHPVTRYRVIVHPFLIHLAGSARRPVGHCWATPEKLAELGLPAPHRKLIQAHFLLQRA